VSSKDFLTRPRSNRNFFAGYWFNFRHESRRRSKIVGSAWPRPEGRAVAIFRSECCPSHPASSAGKSPVDWQAESAKNCSDLNASSDGGGGNKRAGHATSNTAGNRRYNTPAHSTDMDKDYSRSRMDSHRTLAIRHLFQSKLQHLSR